MNAIEKIESYGYAIVSREVFMGMEDVLSNGGTESQQVAQTETLKARASNCEGDFILYDPSGDEGGWLLVGDDPEWLAQHTIDCIID